MKLSTSVELTTSDYGPFMTGGFISLVNDSIKVHVKILRDTGSLESFIIESSVHYFFF